MVPGARESLKKLVDANVPFIFVTNGGGETCMSSTSRVLEQHQTPTTGFESDARAFRRGLRFRLERTSMSRLGGGGWRTPPPSDGDALSKATNEIEGRDVHQGKSFQRPLEVMSWTDTLQGPTVTAISRNNTPREHAHSLADGDPTPTRGRLFPTSDPSALLSTTPALPRKGQTPTG